MAFWLPHFGALPTYFTNKEFTDIARSLSINERTATRYIAAFCEKGIIRRDQPGKYTNLTLSDLKDPKESEAGNAE